MVGALFLVLGLVVAALRPASYTASTQLLVYVRELQPGPEPVISAGRADLTQVENEIEIIRSRGLLASHASTSAARSSQPRRPASPKVSRRPSSAAAG